MATKPEEKVPRLVGPCLPLQRPLSGSEAEHCGDVLAVDREELSLGGVEASPGGHVGGGQKGSPVRWHLWEAEAGPGPWGLLCRWREGSETWQR